MLIVIKWTLKVLFLMFPDGAYVLRNLYKG